MYQTISGLNRHRNKCRERENWREKERERGGGRERKERKGRPVEAPTMATRGLLKPSGLRPLLRKKKQREGDGEEQIKGKAAGRSLKGC